MRIITSISRLPIVLPAAAGGLTQTDFPAPPIGRLRRFGIEMAQVVARPLSQLDVTGVRPDLFLRVRIAKSRLQPNVALALVALLLPFQLSQTARAQTTERALPVILSFLFNNDGIATADLPTNGDLDGSVYSFLDAAVPPYSRASASHFSAHYSESTSYIERSSR